jgi:hypothetical protein
LYFLLIVFFKTLVASLIAGAEFLYAFIATSPSYFLISGLVAKTFTKFFKIELIINYSPILSKISY